MPQPPSKSPLETSTSGDPAQHLFQLARKKADFPGASEEHDEALRSLITRFILDRQDEVIEQAMALASRGKDSGAAHYELRTCAEFQSSHTFACVDSRPDFSRIGKDAEHPLLGYELVAFPVLGDFSLFHDDRIDAEQFRQACYEAGDLDADMASFLDDTLYSIDTLVELEFSDMYRLVVELMPLAHHNRAPRAFEKPAGLKQLHEQNAGNADDIASNVLDLRLILGVVAFPAKSTLEASPPPRKEVLDSISRLFSEHLPPELTTEPFVVLDRAIPRQACRSGLTHLHGTNFAIRLFDLLKSVQGRCQAVASLHPDGPGRPPNSALRFTLFDDYGAVGSAVRRLLPWDDLRALVKVTADELETEGVTTKINIDL